MADAGKIVITPKGVYSSTSTYEWLDEVTYDGKSYIALKTVTGVTPIDDGVNWRLFLEPNDIIAGNLVPTFTEASTRSNIISEENLSTILGKVKKYFTDLKGHAFNDTVKNLTTEETGSALDASQGKVLKDEVDEINSNLIDQKMLGWTVPKECPIQNVVSGNQFIQKVGRVDLEFLSSIQLSYWEGHGYHTTNSVASILPVKATGKCYTNKYPYSETGWVDGTCSITNEKKIIFADDSYADVSAFRNAMRGQYLYYELETPITMQIDGHEAIEQINESLADYGLNNVIGNITQGSIYADNGAINAADTSRVVTSELHPCKNGDVITIKRNSNVKFYMYLYNSDGTVKSGTSWDSTSDTYKITHNGYYRVIFAFTDDSTISPISCGNIRLYQNSTIDELKNDLDKLNSLPKGSIIQIEADKDDTETTTQKYGWQYLGTSNIQYENGSANLLVTNVYRKNN